MEIFSGNSKNFPHGPILFPLPWSDTFSSPTFHTPIQNYVSQATIISLILQLLDCFGSLMDRPRIHADFEHKYPVLLSMFENDLDTAKIIFDQQQTYESNEETLPINKNKPPISGCLKWAQELRERIKIPMSSLKLSLNHG